MSRLSKDQWGIQLAQVTAQRATCLRRAVGCVLVNERGHVLATGYNGVASGLPHCNEQDGESIQYSYAWDEHRMLPRYPHACSGAYSPSGTNLDCCQAIHAEQNALMQCKDIHEIHTCYTTTSPCVTCVKLLMNTSCQRIVFAEAYPQPEAERLWFSKHDGSGVARRLHHWSQIK